jgi:hypothetical protein
MHDSGASRRENAELRLMRMSAPHSQPSSPAKAGDPVFRVANDGIEKPRRTGYPAGACHRARRRRDPVAEYDGVREERRDETVQTPSFPDAQLRIVDGALAPDLRCAIAHRGISRFRVRRFASPRNDGSTIELS